MLIEPYSLLNEAAHLQGLGCGDVWERLAIDTRCVVITPVHQAMNRLRELSRGKAAHGSCGLGVGEATADAIDQTELTLFAGELSNRSLVARKLKALIELKAAQLNDLNPKVENQYKAASDLAVIRQPRWIEVMAEACAAIADAAKIFTADQANAVFRKPGVVVFEGAQGVLLDEDYGFHPHTTWSRTTPVNAVQLLREAGISEPPRCVGVLRSYMTRHGAGPFVTENSALRAACPEPHNADSGTQGEFRVGEIDLVAASYAAEAARVDELAITHLDAVNLLPNRTCTGYSTGPIAKLNPTDFQKRRAFTQLLLNSTPIWQPIDNTSGEAFVEHLQVRFGIPVTLTSAGPTRLDKRVRR
jgi:adenylosuccinate synthase